MAMITQPRKQKVELRSDLCGTLQVLGKKVPLAPRERPTYDKTVRWIICTHPDIEKQIVDELTF